MAGLVEGPLLKCATRWFNRWLLSIYFRTLINLRKSVPHSRLSDDVQGVVRIPFHFLSQVGNVDPEIMGIILITGPPRGKEELPMGHHPTRL